MHARAALLAGFIALAVPGAVAAQALDDGTGTGESSGDYFERFRHGGKAHATLLAEGLNGVIPAFTLSAGYAPRDAYEFDGYLSAVLERGGGSGRASTSLGDERYIIPGVRARYYFREEFPFKARLGVFAGPAFHRQVFAVIGGQVPTKARSSMTAQGGAEAALQYDFGAHTGLVFALTPQMIGKRPLIGVGVGLQARM